MSSCRLQRTSRWASWVLRLGLHPAHAWRGRCRGWERTSAGPAVRLLVCTASEDFDQQCRSVDVRRFGCGTCAPTAARRCCRRPACPPRPLMSRCGQCCGRRAGGRAWRVLLLPSCAASCCLCQPMSPRIMLIAPLYYLPTLQTCRALSLPWALSAAWSSCTMRATGQQAPSHPSR